MISNKNLNKSMPNMRYFLKNCKNRQVLGAPHPYPSNVTNTLLLKKSKFAQFGSNIMSIMISKNFVYLVPSLCL